MLERFLRDKKESSRVMYYFCSHERLGESAVSLLRVLLHQLLSGYSQSQYDELYDRLSDMDMMKEYNLQSGVAALGLEEFMELLQRKTHLFLCVGKITSSSTIDTVAVAKCSEVCIIIDGLDEIPEERIGEFIPLLVRLIERSTDTIIIRMFLSSRPEERIQDGLAKIAHRLPITPEVVDPDIAKFARGRLEGVQKVNLSEEDKAGLCAELVQRSQGLSPGTMFESPRDLTRDRDVSMGKARVRHGYSV